MRPVWRLLGAAAAAGEMGSSSSSPVHLLLGNFTLLCSAGLLVASSSGQVLCQPVLPAVLTDKKDDYSMVLIKTYVCMFWERPLDVIFEMTKRSASYVGYVMIKECVMLTVFLAVYLIMMIYHHRHL